ncbi:MAG: tetratricopeptide repeat protein [Bacteroidetes bacterium]|nr:tetratricopeptide repeat protein [Bacteroidota bacterium]MBU1717467.1 tetratricopeptide repeat protein [Bacteroidota bacterium]
MKMIAAQTRQTRNNTERISPNTRRQEMGSAFLRQIILLICVFFSGIFISPPASGAGSQKADSLLNIIHHSADDTVKVQNIIRFCQEVRFSDPEKFLFYSKAGLELAKKLNEKSAEGRFYNFIGKYYETTSEFPVALKCYLQASACFEQSKDSTSLAYVNIGIGNVHYMLKNYDEALKSYLAPIPYLARIGDKPGIARLYNNIGNIYYSRDNKPEALKYYQQSLKLKIEINDQEGVAYSYNNIALVYSDSGNFQDAIENFLKALVIRDSMGDTKAISASLNYLSSAYIGEKDFVMALSYAQQAIEVAQKANSQFELMSGYQNLLEIYSAKKDFERAYESALTFISLKDSIYNETTTSQIAEMQAKYENEKQASKILLLNKDKALQDAEIRSQTNQKYIFIAGFIFALILLVLAIFSYRKIKFQHNIIEEKNEELNQRNEEISNQRDEIEKKNKNITDSIKYAVQIQKAILPTKETIERLIPDSFILFRPKDIVSGDFYWLAEKHGKVLISAIDCTGHGVPGAFMSIVGNNILKQAVNEFDLSSPDEILNCLSRGVNETLRQQTMHESEVKDGMDLSLCTVNREKMVMQFAGVNNPMYIVRKGEVLICEPEKYPIGEPFHDEFYGYSHKEYALEKGDALYLFSDGYIDQFGGPNRKKILSKRFREILVSVQHLSMQQQRTELIRVFDEWRGGIEQYDDVLVLGIRI